MMRVTLLFPACSRITSTEPDTTLISTILTETTTNATTKVITNATTGAGSTLNSNISSNTSSCHILLSFLGADIVCINNNDNISSYYKNVYITPFEHLLIITSKAPVSYVPPTSSQVNSFGNETDETTGSISLENQPVIMSSLFNDRLNNASQNWIEQLLNTTNSSVDIFTNISRGDSQAQLAGPLFLHTVANNKPPKHWQADPDEAVASPPIGATMIIFVIFEIALMILCDARLVARQIKMARRNIRGARR